MNPLALELNEQLKKEYPVLLDMLSDLGKSIYYPKGILSQSGEAKGTKYNATIGMATTDEGIMYADALYNQFGDQDPSDIFPYSPPQGDERLRTLWEKKILKDNPDLSSNDISKPIVTNALTHGLSLAGDLFVNAQDTILLPEHNWGNYKLAFGVRHSANIETYQAFEEDGSFTLEYFKNALENYNKEKVVLVLNFPNNPTGYTPVVKEVEEMVASIKKLADKGTQVITLVDDAYYGLFFEDVYKQSVFTALTQLDHENVMPVKIDGATKEYFAWGFRVGFLTFGSKNEKVKDVLVAKLKGLIRSNLSSCSLPSQTAIIHAMEDPSFQSQIDQNIKILKERYEVTKEVAYRDAYKELWTPYAFNSGYFMAVKVKDVDPEELRLHLINNYSIGIIALNKTDIRIAFSCIEKSDIEHVFESIANAIHDLK
ncbi:aminotransferase class I/II-fold pyridoxal phosphate-dependent enzyme [Mammaliicoccus fleurettii]|uniref:aminotransferase class I/II-fold pyridoxal phosphate-dependent enzyme n=1 Tax=Mammaliicoccus fleurettii TaxID=150056 RepID=UPI002DB6EC7A|nr:aminotransferase class I/II-fold pyridoxal phosphate-dependent enzyme [Mammaliicoccus fleurettii]MEB7807212.1 aminotransferase class I/II-fold pyridoxal phosphate-dependent enzyme [Mammaliicoccus fleurettii]